jgi:hypothetical protein
MSKRHRQFTVDDRTYSVRRPGVLLKTKASLLKDRVIRDGVANGMPSLVDLRWNQQKCARYKTLEAELKEDARRLSANDPDSQQLATEMRRKRNELRQLTAETTQLYDVSADKLAEEAKLVMYVVECTFCDNGTKYFASVDDFHNRDEAGDPVASEAYEIMTFLAYEAVQVDLRREYAEDAVLSKVDGYIEFLDDPVAV